MSTQKIIKSKLDDPDMQAAPAALLRAAKRAHKIAHQTGTKIIVMRNGKPIEVDPAPKMYKDVPDVPPKVI